MAKEPKKPPPDEDPAQSKRFLDLAAELEAAGDLNLIDAGGQFRKAFERAIPEKKTAGASPAAEVVDPKARPKPA